MKTHAMRDRILSAFLAILSLAWVYPVVMILLNSLKKETAITTGTAFEIPTAETFGGLENYMNAIQSQGFPAAFWNTLVITLTSVVLILICCSMCAWFITRVKTWYSKALYYLFVFSMVVPFQMVMFTLSSTANRLNLDTPCTHGACPGTDGELCAGCRSENRICAMYTVLARQRVKGRIHVILIGEEVGY